MSDALKIGTALAGGYLLGRTKKAKAAVGLALWLTGRGRPRDWVRQGVLSLAQTPEFQDVLKQARGPLLESAKGVAGSTLNSRLNSLSDDLHRRTTSLTGESEEQFDESDQPDQPDQGGSGQGDAGQGGPEQGDPGQAGDAGSQGGESGLQRGDQGPSGDRSAGSRQDQSRKPPARQQA